MIEFEVNGRSYVADKLNAFQQMHVARRLAPLISGFGGAEIPTDGQAPTSRFMAALGPGMSALAGLADIEVDYVVNTCLGTVKVQVEGGRGYQRLMPQPGALMYDDIELPEMLQIVWHVLEGNLAGFFPTSRQSPDKATDQN